MSELLSTTVEVLLFIHVVAGIVALLSAFVAASNKKGAKRHRLVGQVFFGAMFIVGVTAIPVTFVNPNPFLFFIALFSFYMAYAGWRRGKARYQPRAEDLVAAVLMVVTGVVMIGYGLYMAITQSGLGFALIAFGALGLSFGIRDWSDIRRTPSHSHKVQIHVSRMLGGTIATITAVLVQQVSPLIDSELGKVVLWLAPTIVISPFIALWIARIQITGKYRLLPTPKA